MEPHGIWCWKSVLFGRTSWVAMELLVLYSYCEQWISVWDSLFQGFFTLLPASTICRSKDSKDILHLFHNIVTGWWFDFRTRPNRTACKLKQRFWTQSSWEREKNKCEWCVSSTILRYIKQFNLLCHILSLLWTNTLLSNITVSLAAHLYILFACKTQNIFICSLKSYQIWISHWIYPFLMLQMWLHFSLEIPALDI